jgi:hypothetical protein
MALGAVLAAALTDHSSRKYAAWVGGVDVSKEPATTPRYGVVTDSVDIDIAGPGGVSSCSFVVDDPSKVLTFLPGQEVILHDFLNGDVRMFTGFVDSVSAKPDYGQQGRQWTVSATGVEALLDWCVTTYDLTFSAILNYREICQAIFAACLGTGQLRAFADLATEVGSQDKPIGRMVNVSNQTPDFVAVAGKINAGTTLRQALVTAYGFCPGPFEPQPVNLAPRITVSHDYGLHVWSQGNGGVPTTFFGTFGFPGLSELPEGLTFEQDGTNVVRAVYVKGTGASAYVTDGSGAIGRQAVLSLPALTTSAACQAAGVAYLTTAGFTASRLSFVVSDTQSRDWGYADRAMGAVTLTDASLGLSSVQYAIVNVNIRLHGGGVRSKVVRVSLAGAAPAGSFLLRQLTRDTLS